MRRYLIKTYCYESGLFYLSKNLGDKLLSEGHVVVYAPKAKYILDGRVYRRVYPSQKNPDEFKRDIILPFTAKRPVSYLMHNAIIKYKIDTVISFETLMEKGQWVAKIKARDKVKMIDVPMVEWVTPSYVKNGSYDVFDEIWCLTDLTKQVFDMPKAKRVNFDLVDRSIFYPPESKQNDIVTFYHAGSLNPDHSTKNTDLVVAAFNRFLRVNNPKAKLIFTGSTERIAIDNHTNILHIDRVLNRNEIGKIYREADVVLAPSQKEGLGLSLYEAQACGCKIITTDAAPMNEVEADYLCRVDKLKRDRGFIPLAFVNEDEIYNQIKQAYEDIING
jgi:glycosyltransferase involved in cell wall biosynthesis